MIDAVFTNEIRFINIFARDHPWRERYATEGYATSELSVGQVSSTQLNGVITKIGPRTQPNPEPNLTHKTPANFFVSL